jgi:hypothetical protein
MHEGVASQRAGAHSPVGPAVCSKTSTTHHSANSTGYTESIAALECIASDRFVRSRSKPGSSGREIPPF